MNVLSPSMLTAGPSRKPGRYYWRTRREGRHCQRPPHSLRIIAFDSIHIAGLALARLLQP